MSNKIVSKKDLIFYIKQKTAYEMRISDWSSDVCSSDLHDGLFDSVRGMGLMLGIKLKSESRAFVAHLRDNHGLLTVAAGDNVVRILPPLNIGQGHIDECIEKLSEGAASYTPPERSEEHTSELQSLMRTQYAVFCLKKKQKRT